MANTARLEEQFGKDLGLVHEVVVTGRKVGASRDFWAKLAHDESKFCDAVDLVLGGDAVTNLGDFITFTTSGLSIAEQIARYPEIVTSLDPVEAVLHERGRAGRRLSVRRNPPSRSLGLAWDKQKLIIGKGEFVAKPWEVVDAAVAFKEATGQWPRYSGSRWLRADGVYMVERPSLIEISYPGRRRVMVRFLADGGHVIWDYDYGPDIGLAVAKKADS